MSNHILALDLETTGLDFKTNSIIEIGCVHFNGNERVSEYQLKFRPRDNARISMGALRVNKFCSDDSERMEYAPALADFVRYIMTTVIPVSGNKEIKILGHNVAFDVTWLRYALEQQHITGWSEIFSHRVMDTAGLGEFLRETGILQFDKMSLGNLATALGVVVEKDKLHGALYDAELSAKCYFAMKELMRVNYGKSI